MWKGLKDITNFKTPSPSTVENQQLADDLKEFYCRYRQHVTCPTRDSNKLDHCYTAKKDAYHSVPWAALGLSAAATDLDELTETVTSYISFFEDMCIPTRTYLTYNNDNPWFTAKLSQLRQAKEDARRNGDRVLYKQAKYTLEKEIRVAKRNYSELFSSLLVTRLQCGKV